MSIIFNENLQNLIASDEFQRLKRTYVNYSMFNFFTSKSNREEEMSQFIAWLLNPREAHNSVIFFEHFIKSLIDTNDDGSINITHLSADCYTWDVEVTTHEKKSIDIFGTPLIKGLPMLIIENKIQAGLSGKNQLKSYKKYADELSKSNSCESLLILMDALDRDLLATKKEAKDWIQINYEWIGSSINSYLQAPCAPEVSHILKSYLTEYEDYFENDYSEFTYWEKSFEDIKTLHKNFPDLIKSNMYKQLIGSGGKPNEILKESKLNNELGVFFKYFEIFQDLCDFDDSEALSYSASNHDSSVEYETQHNGHCYSIFYVEGLPLLRDEDWVIYISYQREKREFQLRWNTTEKSEYAIEVKNYFRDLRKEIDKKFDKDLSTQETRNELHKRLIILKNKIAEFKNNDDNRNLIKTYESERS